jgi:hypothetical protein
MGASQIVLFNRHLINLQLVIAHAFETQSPKGTAKVHLINWVDYKRAMVEGRGRVWDLMLKSDVVVGGYGFQADFL